MTEIIEVKDNSDGQMSFLARCNDDPTTDSWATITLSHEMDEAAVDALVDSTVASHKDRVEKLYAVRNRAKNKLQAMKAAKK